MRKDISGCPFCDSNNLKEIKTENSSDSVYFVKCIKCSASGPVCDSSSDSITKWNRRNFSGFNKKTVDLKNRLKLVFTDSFMFYKSKFLEIMLFCLPVLLLSFLIKQYILYPYDGAVKSEISIYLNVTISLLIAPLISAIMITIISNQFTEEPRKNLNIILSSLLSWFAIFKFKLLVYISFGVLAASIFAFYALAVEFRIGIVPFIFLLIFSLILIFPALNILLKLAFPEILLVLNKTTLKESIKHSIDYTKNHLILILTSVLIFMSPLYAFNILSDIIVQYSQNNIFLSVVINIFLSILSLFLYVVIYRIYALAVIENE